MDMTLLLVLGGLALVAIFFVLFFIFKQKTPEEAIEVGGYRRSGKLDSISYQDQYDEEVMNKRFRCPNCDSEIMFDEEQCPSCGTKFMKNQFECPSCSKDVDPREKECPYCGEILLDEPYVCPNCSNPVNPDANSCERCNGKFWSPIRLDQKTLERRRRPVQEEVPTSESQPEKKESEPAEGPHPGRGRRVR